MGIWNVVEAKRKVDLSVLGDVEPLTMSDTLSSFIFV